MDASSLLDQHVAECSEPQNKSHFISKAQLKELAYNPRKPKQTMPIQYTWPAEGQDVGPSEEDMPFTQLRAGESLLEIHLKVLKTLRYLALL